MANRGIGSSSDIRKKLSYNHELIMTSVHESGHTISSLLNGFLVSSVGIDIAKDRRSNKDAGYTYFDSILDVEIIEDPTLISKLLISEIHINYAGLAAEKIFYKEICGTDKLPMYLKYGTYVDRQRASEIVKKNNLAPPGVKRHLFKNKLFNQCKKALENHWSDVKLISHALFSRKKLLYADLKEILIKKSVNKAFWKQQLKNIEMVFEAAKLNNAEHVYKTINN